MPPRPSRANRRHPCSSLRGWRNTTFHAACRRRYRPAREPPHSRTAPHEPRQANAGAEASKLGTGLCVYIPPKGSLYSSALIGPNRDTKRSKPIEPAMRMATNTINIALPPAGLSILVLMLVNPRLNAPRTMAITRTAAYCQKEIPFSVTF